jgi:hypothetical protein
MKKMPPRTDSIKKQVRKLIPPAKDSWFKSCQGSKLQSMMFCIGMPIYKAQLNSPREEAPKIKYFKREIFLKNTARA